MEMLHKERESRLRSLQHKRVCLKQELKQQICFRNLIKRNKECEEEERTRKSNKSILLCSGSEGIKNQLEDKEEKDSQKVQLPFVVINTSNNTTARCEMNHERTDVCFQFNNAFEVQDDSQILKRLGFSRTTNEDLRQMLPRDLMAYCEANNLIDDVVLFPVENNNGRGIKAPNKIPGTGKVSSIPPLPPIPYQSSQKRNPLMVRPVGCSGLDALANASVTK